MRCRGLLSPGHSSEKVGGNPADRSILTPMSLAQSFTAVHRSFEQTCMAEQFNHNPFAALCSTDLPPGPEATTPKADQIPDKSRKSRGRVDIIRQKAGR